MTPMIDVVFLLLIFFLATASFDRIEKSMPTAIADIPPPQSQQASGVDQWLQDVQEAGEEIVIKIRKAGDGPALTYELNQQPIASAKDIGERLIALARAKADLPIIVDPEEAVGMGAAMEIYDLAKGAGAIEVYFATSITP